MSARLAQKPQLVRGAAVVRKVLEAVVVELADKGYHGLSVDDVATRAQVARTTIYRRWPTKAELVRAAIEAMPGAEIAEPNTGSLRSSLIEIGLGVARFLEAPSGAAIMRLFGQDNVGPELAEILIRLRQERDGAVRALVDRWQRLGHHVSDPELVTELLPAALFSRAVLTKKPVDRAFVERLVDFLLAHDCSPPA